jgi:hypothetical protein
MIDRGHKKWTSIIIPEHQVMLEDLWISRNNEMKPELHEDQLTELQLKLETTLQSRTVITINYFAQHENHYVTGTIDKYDSLKQLIVLITTDSKTLEIRLIDILNIS